MHLQPVFKACRKRGGAVGEQAFEFGLCLPSGSSLAASDRDQVVDTVRGLYRR